MFRTHRDKNSYAAAHITGRFARFGSFELDLKERKLTKMGARIRLQGQPFRILALLLERSGQLVTREEIRQTLWPQEVFVNFDAALNTAVRKLREALNDPADNPRFVETVARQGYRFVAPADWMPEVLLPITSRARRCEGFLAIYFVISAICNLRNLIHGADRRCEYTGGT